MKQKNKKNSEENFKIVRKNPIKKFLIIIILAIIITSFFYIIYKAYIFQSLAKEMFSNKASTIFDQNNNVIAILGTERNNENTTLSELPKDLINSYIAIEDKRFYSHHGIDIKRTSAAIFSYIFHQGNSSFGGSTITQQLVKNLTGDDSSSIKRKVKEWFYAFSLECFFSKDEILEAYLNIIYTGPNIYGVKEASTYYFNKDITDLNLAECAFLAGLTNSPNSYNPFTTNNNEKRIITRTTTVLNQMLKQNYIQKEEYDLALDALNQGLNFNKRNNSKTQEIYSYHTDALLNELISDISNKKHISQDFALNYLKMSNLSIYSTVNNEIQTTLENEFKDKKYILKSIDESTTSQSAMVIIDHSSGYILGCQGGLGKKTTSRCFNRVTQMKRQTGSAMKPIAVLAPALAENLITTSTIFLDEPTTFIDYNGKEYSPTNYDGYKHSITLRQAVESSQNIPFVTIMEKLTAQKSIKYLKKMGITTLTENDINLSLALGGLDKGISPLEFAGAYATIANDGIYIEPTFYTKVKDKYGNTIIKSSQKRRRVLSSSVAYTLKELLTQPVKGNSGTATYCDIPKIDVAAKTGTTNENYDRWLCGFTPYYTSVCWYGFDMNETINFNGKNPAGLIWSSVMTKIHSKLPSAKF